MSRRLPELPSPELLSRRPWGCAALGAALRCDPLLVAISGGSDSTALLCAAARLRAWLWRGRNGAPPLFAAHFNHRIRGAEADADEASVVALCHQLRVPLLRGGADVPAEAAHTGESLEMAARRLRRAFLLDSARKCGAAVIATGHTADDRAETFFLRLKRGASLRGLSGPGFFSPGADSASPSFIKPFLRLGHDELRNWLRAQDVAWCEDSTNADPDAADRNRIRHSLLPAADAALGTAFRETLGRTLDLMREDADLLDALARAPDRAAAICSPAPPPLARRAAAARLYAAGEDPESVTLDRVAAEAPADLPPNPRIGIFGGSFDPVHRGHLALARAALEEAGLDRILFVPTAVSPFKTGEPPAPAHDRVEMLRRATAGEPRFVVDETDLRRGGVSYTVSLLEALRQAGPPDAQWFFLVGADSLLQLHSWHRAADVVRLARFVSFGRPGSAVEASSLGFDPATSARLAADFHPSLAEPVSSTQVRQLLGVGDEARGLVPPEVAAYALKRGLYRTEGAP